MDTNLEAGVEYRDVPGHPGYRVGDDGSIWTRKNGRYGVKNVWRKMRPGGIKEDGKGYLSVNIGGKSIALHRLVMLVFIGECPSGMVSRHKDGDKWNNKKDNLVYGTQKENVHDAIQHGTSNPHKKLGPQQVLEIRARASKGDTHKTIAKDYGVTSGLVGHIVTGRIWKYVGGEIIRSMMINDPKNGQWKRIIIPHAGTRQDSMLTAS